VTAHVKEDWTGSKLANANFEEGPGGSGEKQAEREWYEGDRRERDDEERERQGIEQWCGTYFISEKTFTQFFQHSRLN